MEAAMGGEGTLKKTLEAQHKEAIQKKDEEMAAAAEAAEKAVSAVKAEAEEAVAAAKEAAEEAVAAAKAEAEEMAAAKEAAEEAVAAAKADAKTAQEVLGMKKEDNSEAGNSDVLEAEAVVSKDLKACLSP